MKLTIPDERLEGVTVSQRDVLIDIAIGLYKRQEIIVTVRMVGGRVVSFVVRLVARKGDVEVDVARYDTAHGKGSVKGSVR